MSAQLHVNTKEVGENHPVFLADAVKENVHFQVQSEDEIQMQSGVVSTFVMGLFQVVLYTLDQMDKANCYQSCCNSKVEEPQRSISHVCRFSAIESEPVSVHAGNSHRTKPCCINLWDAAAKFNKSKMSTICGVALQRCVHASVGVHWHSRMEPMRQCRMMVIFGTTTSSVARSVASICALLFPTALAVM
eukprot:127318-Ditylum_brightwellii.AAC.3